MEKIILDDRYEIIEQIGVGGMAKVYKAKDKLLGRFVAIKILKSQYAEDSEFLKKFNNEAQSAAKLSHINIVNVFDIGEDLYNGEMVYYIVMEYVEGQTLKDLIVSEHTLSNHDIIDYSTQIAQALKSAHASGIIHRDIKPQNILIDNYGLAKVTDFGIARVSSNATITYTSSILGTVHYISPEQAKGKIVDEKSDLYSLGAVMYEMATGKVPFDADNSVGIAVMHIQDEPIAPKELNPDLSDHLNQIIMKLLNKEPSQRFLNSKELIEALDNENYIEENDDNNDTARIPIVVPQDKNEPPIYPKEEEIEDEKEAVYVSNSELDEENSKKTRNKKLWPLALLAVLLLTAVYFIRNRNTDNVIEVPTVINLTQSQAVSELERRGLKANIARSEESDEYESGKVMEQDPAASSKVNKGTQINLVISKGREVSVPDLSNMTLSQAEEKLKELGLRLGRTTTQSSENVDKDLIITQNPGANAAIQTGSEVDVTISTGSDGRFLTVDVPNLVGENEEKARSLVAENKLTLRNVDYQFSNSVEAGIVISQSIAEATQVAENSQIDFVVSKGPEEVEEKEPEEKSKDDQNNSQNDGNKTRDVEIRLNIPEDKSNFKVVIYKIVNGERTDILYSQDQTKENLNENGVLILHFKSIIGTSVEVLVDNESYGVYEVN